MNDQEKKRYNDELLSGYVDGVLNQRQYTEIKRLLQHDPHLAEQLRIMQSQRKVLNMLPTETAPETLLEEVKARLERQYILNGLPDGDADTGKAWGFKRVLQRVAAVAAMVLIPLGLLTFVVTEIMKPAEMGVDSVGSGPVAVVDRLVGQEEAMSRSVPASTKTQPIANVDETIGSAVAAVETTEMSKSAMFAMPDGFAFRGLLRLHTADSDMVSRFIEKQLYTLGVIDEARISHAPDRDRYIITDQTAVVTELVDGMKTLWPRCEKTMLILKPNSPPDEQIHIQAVLPGQIVLLASNHYEKSFLAQAKQFAAGDTQTQLGVSREESRVLDDKIKSVEPILTWDKNADISTAEPSVDDDEKSRDVTLIIEVVKPETENGNGLSKKEGK